MNLKIFIVNKNTCTNKFRNNTIKNNIKFKYIILSNCSILHKNCY